MRRTLIGLIAGIAIGVAMISMSGVGKAAEGEAGSSNPLTAWIPDLKEVLNDALRDMFDSSSAEISDPAIAEFYGKLTNNLMENVTESSADSSFAGSDIDFPLLRIASPVASSGVSGQVVIQIDAVDDRDPIGSLTVSIVVDGVTSIPATFSPVTGYYEAIWDSSVVPTGTLHTIGATVIDSDGDSGSVITAVSVG
jgi:hypothetical protein